MKVNLILCSIFISASYGFEVTGDPLLVKTTQGLILGHLNEENMREWKGIPYAKPPVDHLRWQSPQKPEPFADGFVYQANFNAPGKYNLI